MTLNDILSEMNFEIGNNKVFALKDKMISHKTIDKSGDMDEVSKNNLVDANKLSKPTKIEIQKILNYINKEKLTNRVSKLDLNSSDIVMKADGGADVNFDDGGTVKIPASVLRNFNY